MLRRKRLISVVTSWRSSALNSGKICLSQSNLPTSRRSSQRSARSSQLAVFRKREQLSVGGPLPQEERQTRGQLQIAQRMEFCVFLILRPGDAAIEKIRAHQNRSHHLLDPGVEPAGSLTAGVVESHQPA